MWRGNWESERACEATQAWATHDGTPFPCRLEAQRQEAVSRARVGVPSGRSRAESCLDPQRTLSCWQSLQQWQISPFPSPSHFPLEPRIGRIPPEQSYLGRTRDIVCLGFPSGKESTYQCKTWGLIPGSGRLPGGGNGNSLQCSCLANPLDRGAWQATVHGVAKEPDMTEQLSVHTQIH